MDTTTATDLAKSVFAEIQQLIAQGQAQVVTNSTDSSNSGVPGSAQNAFSQIQQSFETAQAQVLANLGGSEANTTASTTTTATTDTSTVATSTDTSTATATTAAPSVEEQLIQAGQNQVTASLANDSLTNPGSDTSSSNSTSPVFEFVPATDSSSGSFGQVNAIIGGETTPLFTLGTAGPVSASGDGQDANANSFLSYIQQQIGSLSTGTTSTI